MKPLLNFKDSYKMNIINSYRFAKGFIQNLVALTFDGDNPTGMSDSVAGNNPIFKNSPCFKGNNTQALFFDLKNDIVLTNNDSFEFSIYEYDAVTGGGWAVSRVFLGQKTSATNYIAKFASRFVIILGGVIVFDHTFTEPVFTNGFNEGKYIFSHDGLGNYTCVVEDLTNGNTYSQTQSNATTYTTIYNRLFNRSATTIYIREQKYFDLIFNKNGSELHAWPLSESIIDAANHIALDVVGDNYAVLSGGALTNEGVQDKFHWGQNGFAVSDGINYYYDQNLTQLVPINHIIPAHSVQSGKCAAYTTGGVLADLTVTQDNTKFLKYADVKLQQPDIQALKDADIHNVYFDVGGNPKETTFDEIQSAISVYPDVYGGNVVVGESIKNITLK